MRKRFLSRAVDKALRAIGLSRRSASRAYAGAKLNGLTSDWFTSMLSADQEIKGSAPRLRARARDLVRNFPYASRFVQSCAENIVGPDGIRLQVRVETVQGPNAGALKRSLNDEVEAKWTEWCEPGNCTVDGRLGFTDLEHLIAETEPQDGEVLIRIVRGFPDNPFKFALQLLDADQLDEQYERAGDTAGNGWVRMGVEMNRWGRPTAYYLWTLHPSEYGRGAKRRERVPAEDIIHLFVQRRPGQSRGVTWFHPVLIAERMIGGWEEASITAARAGALTPFFLKGDPDKVNEENQLDTSVSMELSPEVQGQVLPLGYDVSTFDPKYPNAEFDPFRNALLQSVAAGLRISHFTLTGDTRQANYSSMRVGLLPEREAWKLLARRLVRHFHARVYREWVRAAVLAGALEVPPRELERVLKADTWQFRGFPWIDPKADIETAQAEVAMGIQSLTNLAAERGRDFEEVIKQRAAEQAIAEENDVELTLGAARPAPTGSTNGDENDAEAKAEVEEAKEAEAEEERAALEERITRARASAEAAIQTVESQARVIDRQAHALAEAARKPLPPAEVRFEPGAIQVTVTNEAPKGATVKEVELTKTEDGRTIGRVVETPVAEETAA